MSKKKGSAKLLTKSNLDTKYGDVVYTPSDEKRLVAQRPWLPSRSLGVNLHLGGGIPYGKVLEEFGYESTGKTILAIDFAVACQALGGHVLWCDAEQAMGYEWLESNGIDLDGISINKSTSIELFSDWVRDSVLYHRARLVNNEPILLVCDSIAGMDTDENMDRDFMNSKAEMGNRAKAWSSFYRVRVPFLAKYGVCTIMINQVRKKLNVSMFESDQTTPGGESHRFFASQRLGLIRSTQVKGYRNKRGVFKEDKSKGVKVGQNIILRTEKNKVAPPQPSVKTRVYFSDVATGYIGFDRYLGILPALVDEGILDYKAARYYHKGKMIAHGEEAMVNLINNDAKLRKKLLKYSTINTISKTRALLADIETNLYPVAAKKSNQDDGEEEDTDN